MADLSFKSYKSDSIESVVDTDGIIEEQLEFDSNYTLVQINGRRILGPPKDYTGPAPENGCELYIKRIPKTMFEVDIVPHFQRFGKVYEFRLMMDYNNMNRGYGYIKYCNEIDALRALEVMPHFIVAPRKTLEIQRSYDKCRLFVGNIPKDLSRETVEEAFQSVFPELDSIVMHNRISERNQNRGFAFLDFRCHLHALLAKKQSTPGLRMWNKDIKIVWANPERSSDPETMNNVKTLFVRNIDLSINTKGLMNLITTAIPSTEVVKCSRVREFGFIDFKNRSAAEHVLNTLQGTVLQGHKLDFEWAMPPSEDSVHILKNNDFDAILRLKCIANYWDVPIVIFGKCLMAENLQYAAIVIKKNNYPHVFFIEITTKGLNDIQSRLCEAILMIIEHFGNLPKFNCVIKIIHDTVHIIGTLTNLDFPNFIVANNLKINERFTIYWNEIESLSIAVDNILICKNEIMEMYQRSLTTQQKFTYIDMLLIENKTVGCIPPGYRCKSPLKYNLNNSQLILVLCDEFTRNNFESNEPMVPYDITKIENRTGIKYEAIYHRELNLLPQHFAQGKHSMQMSCVIYGLPVAKQAPVEYRPAREMTPPNFPSFSGGGIPQRFINNYPSQFELPPPYMMTPPLRESTPPPPPQHSYFAPAIQKFNIQQQFEANQSANGLNDFEGVNIRYSIPPPPGFFPNFPQNNIPPFWVQSDAPFFPPLY